MLFTPVYPHFAAGFVHCGFGHFDNSLRLSRLDQAERFVGRYLNLLAATLNRAKVEYAVSREDHSHYACTMLLIGPVPAFNRLPSVRKNATNATWSSSP